MKWQLVVDQGPRQGLVIPLRQATFLIGRDPDCHLRAAAASVSGRHCVLAIRGGRLFAADCGTARGTFVNEHRLGQEQELHPGDRLQVGPLVFLVGRARRPAATRSGPREVDEEAVARMLLAMDDEANDPPDPGRPAPGAATTEARDLSSTETHPDHAALPAAPRPGESQEGKTARAAEALLGQYLGQPGAGGRVRRP